MMPRPARQYLPAVALVGIIAAVAASARSTLPVAPPRAPKLSDDIGMVAARVDAVITRTMASEGIGPAGQADDLIVLRRMWIALAGTIPSLEEIRRFEADPRPDRLDRWLAMMLADRRSAEHLAALLATILTGTDAGPPFVFRRDRLTAWLADSLHAGRPFDRIVRDLVAGSGLWTGEPEVNFVTQAAIVRSQRVDENVLAGRLARSFLGVQLDCAQCHDHPFAAWRQDQFEGLAACFAAVRISPLGVRDTGPAVLKIDPSAATTGMMAEDDAPQESTASRTVTPRVPFGDGRDEWVKGSGSPREKLAAWLTDPANRRFDRAVANRCWAIVFGHPWHEPVDDLPDPATVPQDDDVLDVLGTGFRRERCDLRRLLAMICSTEAFRRRSSHPDLDDPTRSSRITRFWAAFPMSQLPPGTTISAMVQSQHMRTIDPDSNLLVRTVRFLRSLDFVREYAGRSDHDNHEPATIPQALVRMNGRLVREICKADPFSGSGRIAGLASDTNARLDAVFLACLSRRPDEAERAALVPMISDDDPAPGVEDLYWVLFNSAEFCWNH